VEWNTKNAGVWDLLRWNNQVLSTGVGIYWNQGRKGHYDQWKQRAFPNLTSPLISEFHPGYIFSISGGFGIQVLKGSSLANGQYELWSHRPYFRVGSGLCIARLKTRGELWLAPKPGILFRIIFPRNGFLVIWMCPMAGRKEISERRRTRFVRDWSWDFEGRLYTSGIEGFYYFDSKALKEFERDAVLVSPMKLANINLDYLWVRCCGKQGMFIWISRENKRLAVSSRPGTFKLPSSFQIWLPLVE